MFMLSINITRCIPYFKKGAINLYNILCVMGILYKMCIYAQWFVNVCDVSQSTGFSQGIARVPYFQKSIKNSMLHGMALPTAPMHRPP